MAGGGVCVRRCSIYMICIVVHKHPEIINKGSRMLSESYLCKQATRIRTPLCVLLFPLWMAYPGAISLATPIECHGLNLSLGTFQCR